MMNAVLDLLSRTFSGGTLDSTDVFRLLLLGTTVIATGHLITMLATRWGDRNVALKSLMFSVLAHAMCYMGMATIPPTITYAKEEDRFLEDDREQIRQVLVESDQAVDASDSGNSPVKDTIVDDRQTLARLDHKSSDLKETESFERNPDNQVPMDVPIPDKAKTELEAPPEMAMPEDQGEIADERQTASAPLTAKESPPDAEPENQANLPSRSRLPMARVGTDELEFQRDAAKGSFEKMDLEIEDDVESPDIEDLADADGTFVDDDGDLVKRRSGPIPTTTVEEVAGAPTESTDSSEGAAGAASERRMSRLNVRRRPDRPGRAVDPERQKQIARTPIPLDDKFEQVRESPALDMMSDALEFKPANPDFDAESSRRRPSVPATYRLRNLENRVATARKYGGTEESEKAVEKSLAWLAAQQHPDGYWDASRFGAGQAPHPGANNSLYSGQNADTGVTALTVLSFLGAGYTQEEGKYKETVTKALNWLLSQQGADGNLYGQSTRYARNYSHAMATYALGEAMGMQTDPVMNLKLHSGLLRAVTYIVIEQNPADGGWRYPRAPDSEIKTKLKGDMSMFGWQVMALKSSEVAGINIPKRTKDLMLKFLKSHSDGVDGGLARYSNNKRNGKYDYEISPTMTAEALFCRQMLGYRHSPTARKEAATYLSNNLPRLSNYNLYYWYYGTLAMYQHGGDSWTKWNKSLRDMVINEQVTIGPNSGSWDPRGRYGLNGGRIYSTAMATLSLEVYYRFLPLYNRGIPGEDEIIEGNKKPLPFDIGDVPQP